MYLPVLVLYGKGQSCSMAVSIGTTRGCHATSSTLVRKDEEGKISVSASCKTIPVLGFLIVTLLVHLLI